MSETTITEDPLERRPVRDFKLRSAFALSFCDQCFAVFLPHSSQGYFH